jgi:hypothetical protein
LLCRCVANVKVKSKEILENSRKTSLEKITLTECGPSNLRV